MMRKLRFALDAPQADVAKAAILVDTLGRHDVAHDATRRIGTHERHDLGSHFGGVRLELEFPAVRGYVRAPVRDRAAVDPRIDARVSRGAPQAPQSRAR